MYTRITPSIVFFGFRLVSGLSLQIRIEIPANSAITRDEITWSWPNFEYFTFSLLIQRYVDGSRRNTEMFYKTCIKVSGVVFVLIRLKLVEKTYPGRIPSTSGRISVFFGHHEETDFFQGNLTEHAHFSHPIYHW